MTQNSNLPQAVIGRLVVHLIIRFVLLISMWIVRCDFVSSLAQTKGQAWQQIRSKIDSFQNAKLSYFSTKPYDFTTHWNRLEETI